MEITLRPLRDGDFEYVISRLDEWWGGRSMTGSLPRLFFDHFPATSRLAVDSATGNTVGFIIGFLSQGDPTTAYIHFVGVDPAARGHEVGRTLYEWFFETARAAGRSTVKCLTSTVNTGSVAFHRAMGFTVTEAKDYDGPGQHRMLFTRSV